MILRQPRIVVVLLLALVPGVSSASVQINEIAWMGTSVSANDEWIELYNPDGASVDLTNWTLNWALSGSSPRTVKLGGSIAAGGYYLLERTSDGSVPAVTADLVYVGALSNSGEIIVLKNATGAEVDRVDGSDGWKISSDQVAGDNATKATAQRSASGWLTATGTPKAVNVQPPPAPIVAKPVVADETATTTAAQDSLKTSTLTVTTQSSGISAHSSSVALSDSKSLKSLLAASPGRERMGVVHVPMLFNAVAMDEDKKPVTDARYLWSFGDGSTGEGHSLSHTYLYKGEYIVLLNVERREAEAVGRTLVTVLEPEVIVAGARPGLQGSYVELANNAKVEVNLGGWHLVSGMQTFTFPRDTLIGAGKKLILPFEVSKFMVDEKPIGLTYPDGKELAASKFTAASVESNVVGAVAPVSTVLPASTSPISLPPIVMASSSSQAVGLDRAKVESSLAAIKSQAAMLMLALATTLPSDRGGGSLKATSSTLPAHPQQPSQSTGRSATIAKVVEAAERSVNAVPMPNPELERKTPPGRVLVVPRSPGIFTRFSYFFTGLFSK